MSDHKTIWKFIIPITDDVTIEMPEYAQILPHVAPGPDRQSLMVWAEVRPALPPRRRRFRVVGTGNPIPDGTLHYIATTVAPPFVWHLYEDLDTTAPPIDGGASCVKEEDDSR